MDAGKFTSLQNITDFGELKAKLNDIIREGNNYEHDVSSCLKELLKSSDDSIVLLSIKAISEVVKCDEKRETYAQFEIIEPILNILSKELIPDNYDIFKQCLRALGNLCCDCDTSRKIILDCNGVSIINNMLSNASSFDDIKVLGCKALLNYAIGGEEFSGSLTANGITEQVKKIISSELERDEMNDDLLSTTLLILSVINDNDPQYHFPDDINIAVLKILKETENVEISELCLEHLSTQVREHDSVKILLAKEGGVELICSRLEELMQKQARDVTGVEGQIEGIIKQACNLIVLVLTGDEAMPILYNNGEGQVYLTTVRWLQSTDHHILSTALLAVGNFARRDAYCTQMMSDNMFDKLLDIFEEYHKLSLKQIEQEASECEKSEVNQIQHAALSAVRNLMVLASNKEKVARQGRAAPLLLRALPNIEEHHVAYKLMAALRMLVDKQESVARLVSEDRSALRAIAAWGRTGEHAGAAGEAPRLLAWTLRHAGVALPPVEGCVRILVSMMVASHSVMQNEAITSLTLQAVRTDDIDEFNAQLADAEIGKHVTVLVETNCAKLPPEVAENLLAFLDVTADYELVLCDYFENMVHNALHKLIDSRQDFSDMIKKRASRVISKICCTMDEE
ncbi:GTPase-GDP dissociation stimulator vimar [Leptidea sinapis]|uniref:GTPase-GDP dissociation stimulator vimar n=1 Tax=Leptidea sinapis TaxID=189913 RepID=UPI0021382F31|nr:GTPase-GDP dissociation stimulator vimar [Leptidea sinapis]